MIQPSDALKAIPAGLRDPLLKEFETIVQNFMERKWSPSELSGGRFSEIVYTILDGHARGSYAPAPKKPPNMVDDCRKLEGITGAHIPRSFQILIPRVLPALYEVRNNRGVGHAGGDVDPNHMDALAVLSMCSWVMAELVRVFHATTVDKAQALVDVLVERRVPLVWQDAEMKRVLDPRTPLPNQLLLLLASAPTKVPVSDLMKWTDTKSSNAVAKKHFMRTLRTLHSGRKVELSEEESQVRILPPGSAIVDAIAAKAAKRR